MRRYMEAVTPKAPAVSPELLATFRLSTIQAILAKLVGQWLASGDAKLTDPRSINEGPCREFAEEAEAALLAAIPGITVRVVDEDEVLAAQGLELPNYYHSFLVVTDPLHGENWYYDAEATHGVTDWRDLPFFRRNRMNFRQTGREMDDDEDDDAFR